MFSDSGKRTLAYKVKELAEMKRKEARDKNLDQLFSDTYNKCIKYFPFWAKNSNKIYIHNSVKDLKETGERTEDKPSTAVEFTFNFNRYEITNERQRGFLDSNPCYKRELYMNGKKVFGISESEYGPLWAKIDYGVFTINAFVNEDWVNDFREIRDYPRKIMEEESVKRIEDPVRVEKLKEDFGIGPTEVEMARTVPKKVIFLVALIIILLILIILK